ncbi:hypothetical protein F5Y16DRAFT_389051 [Xylariaceae sp. FL0255]|nr:hypothetical protein F5Y16DRAFT_389051 [Xylariaceae sp. FL0255]
MSSTSPKFTVQANPGTDIWKKPPSTNVWNAPISHTKTGPLISFRSSRVTFWAPWTERYDQGGILLVPRPKTSPACTSSSPAPAKWVKIGVELYQGKPHLSVVCCDRFADWSCSLPNTPLEDSAGVTFEVTREADEHGRSLWVYQLVLDPATGEVKERFPLREICWFFADEDEGEKDWILDVSLLVARPEKGVSEPLVVEFREFDVTWNST